MTGPHIELLQLVAATARAVPSSILECFCELLDGVTVDASRSQTGGLLRSVTQQPARDALSKLVGFWRRKHPDLRADQLAWALRAASVADGVRAQSQSVELVWTGPAGAHTTLRRTEQALLDVIQHAQRSLLIVTFAAYKIPQVADALLAAASRDVEIRFIAESPEASDGKVTCAGFQALGEPLRRRIQLYIWPREQRAMDSSGNFGALHAKCAIADEDVAFISSANLTEHALNLNVELGVLIRGGELPARVSRHIRHLVATGVLSRLRNP